MKELELWQTFYKTGKISDYIFYKSANSEVKTQSEHSNERPCFESEQFKRER